ncbi:MAG: phosphoribosyl-ATP diphosphatase [Alphaproteobacteria bacterium]|jgi:phosphoribosyl-ATP pyrophosphohydrolase
MSNEQHMLDRLYEVIAARKGANAESSYTAKLFARGTPKIAQKLGEEAVETVIAALAQDRAAVTAESADLLYHLLVLWADKGVAPGDVWAELARREGVSGLVEKASRK